MASQEHQLTLDSVVTGAMQDSGTKEILASFVTEPKPVCNQAPGRENHEEGHHAIHLPIAWSGRQPCYCHITQATS